MGTILTSLFVFVTLLAGIGAFEFTHWNPAHYDRFARFAEGFGQFQRFSTSAGAVLSELTDKIRNGLATAEGNPKAVTAVVTDEDGNVVGVGAGASMSSSFAIKF